MISLPPVLKASWEEIQDKHTRGKATRLEKNIIKCVEYLLGCDNYAGMTKEEIYELIRADALSMFESIIEESETH